MKAVIHISPAPGVLDPQGRTIGRALADLGFAGVEEVRQGKVLELWLRESDPETARAQLVEMCETLLANPVIETYRIELPDTG